ncbi:hypothetical protein BDZ94DRAFT_626764 [Collybia nuda]|uniref:Alpha-type protein kinase domain-containing protein n=1 Tax=Collybia nuda TaxID=64659 RepID=A0A9P5XRX1_9AGAR|nr:hypothetical protein BDZ94DRAFT_626764 [Collybia nuda]
MAQFFLDSFYAQAKAAGLGNIYLMESHRCFCWTCKNITPPPDDKEDTQSLIFEDFLATPLLQIDKYIEERKFFGNDNFRSNTDTLGCFIDAYVHYVVCNSFEDILFADIQGGIIVLQPHLRLMCSKLGIISKDGSLCLFCYGC